MTDRCHIYPDEFQRESVACWQEMTSEHSRNTGKGLCTLFSKCGFSIVGLPENDSLVLMTMGQDNKAQVSVYLSGCINWWQKQQASDLLSEIAHRLIVLRVGGWQITSADSTGFVCKNQNSGFDFVIVNPSDKKEHYNRSVDRSIRWRAVGALQKLLKTLQALPDVPPSHQEQQALVHDKFALVRPKEISLPHLILTKYPNLSLDQLTQADAIVAGCLQEDPDADTLYLLSTLPDQLRALPAGQRMD